MEYGVAVGAVRLCGVGFGVLNRLVAGRLQPGRITTN